MRTVVITEDADSIIASDTYGQYAVARRFGQHITYTSYLIDDDKPVQHSSPYSDNWRKQVLELIGF